MKKKFEFREWIKAPLEKLTAVQTSLEPVFREPKLLLDAMFQDPKTYFGLNSKLLIGAVVAVGFIPAVKFLSRMLKKYESEGAKPVEEEASDDQAKIGIKELQHQSDSDMRQEEDSKTTNKSDEDVNGLHEDSAQGEREIILEKTQMAEEETSPDLQKEADEPDCDLMEFDEGNGLLKDSTLTEREIILEKTQMAEEETSPELQKEADEPDCDLMESDGGNGLQKDSTQTEGKSFWKRLKWKRRKYLQNPRKKTMNLTVI
ncbi:nestin-like [Palaemon carinicauda]|uniref:nestin-like n=1 Tax=Palaemon carinicauda TaxID=392227 RepID=UPI0035B64638